MRVSAIRSEPVDQERIPGTSLPYEPVGQVYRRRDVLHFTRLSLITYE